MRSPEHFLFYAHHVTDTQVAFAPAEARHILTVLRAKVGTVITATDGRGAILECRLEGVDIHDCRAVVLRTQRPQPFRPEITLLVGIPDRDGFERALDGCVPLGTGRIIPVICRFSQTPWWSSKWGKLQERFERKMITAIKQARIPWLPTLLPPCSLQDALHAVESQGLFVADEKGKHMEQLAADTERERVSVLVGPPGGFSPEELTLLHTRPHTHFLRLSPTRLRTELAATVAVALLRNHVED